jgi:hypothetical protein
VLFKKMPADYSLARDMFRFVLSVAVMLGGGFICAKLLPDTRITANLLFVWIIGFSGISVFFIARAIAVLFFRLR